VAVLIVAALSVSSALSACSSEPGKPAPPSKSTVDTSVAARAAAPSTSSKPQVDLAHIKAKDVFGDLTTVDPCTLTPVAELPAKYRKGTPWVQVAYGADDCQLHVSVAAHHTADLWFGELATGETARVSGADGPAQDAGGGLTVVRGDSDATYCFHYLLFADGISMLIDAEVDSGATAAELCKAGHDITVGIASHLRAGKNVGHQIVRESSLLHKDACKFLSASMARSVPGLGAVQRFGDFPAHHKCRYEDDASQAVTVEFVRVSADLSFDDGTKLTVAGRATASRQRPGVGGITTCELVTAYTEGAAAKYSHEAVEGLSLWVRRAGRTGTLCGDAAALAEKVWPKLPKS
jgi:hypothetical protein